MTPDEVITSLTLQGFMLTKYDGALITGVPIPYRIKRNERYEEPMLMWGDDERWQVKRGAAKSSYTEVPWSEIEPNARGRLMEEHYNKLIAEEIDRENT